MRAYSRGRPPVTLRRRVGFAAGAAVGIAVVLAAFVCYFVVRGQLRGQVDSALRAQAVAVQQGFGLQRPLPGISAAAGGPAPYAQLVLADGTVHLLVGDLSLPVNSKVLAVAAGNSGPYITDVHVGGSHLREITVRPPFPISGQPFAIQLARP